MIASDLLPGSPEFTSMDRQLHRFALDAHRGLRYVNSAGLSLPVSFSIPDQETVRVFPAASLIAYEHEGRVQQVDISGFDPSLQVELRRPLNHRGVPSDVLTYMVADNKRRIFNAYEQPHEANFLYHALRGIVQQTRGLGWQVSLYGEEKWTQAIEANEANKSLVA